MFVEKSAIVLANGKLIRWIVGGAEHVEFDPKWVLKREETKGDIAGFFHTHPPGSGGMSAHDRRTMAAWAKSFGRPLLCAIQCDRKVRAWSCGPDGGAVELPSVTLRGMKIAWTG
jgi:proteasome lid subunit RPN8/RPN11